MPNLIKKPWTVSTYLVVRHNVTSSNCCSLLLGELELVNIVEDTFSSNFFLPVGGLPIATLAL